MKTSKKDKELIKRLEEFYEEKVERHVRDGYRELEKFLKKEIRIGKSKNAVTPRNGSNGKAAEKDILDEIEAFFENKVEKKVKKGYQELEKFLKKEIRLGNGKGKNKKKTKLLEYDPDSPLSYVAAFMKDKGVAALHPSSKFVVKRVVKAMDLARAKVVVEFGAAEGVMTRQILSRVPADCVVVAVELNDDFVTALRKISDKRLKVVHGNVQEIEKILAGFGLTEADVMVSGIPFSFFNSRERHQLLETILKLLKPKGRFVAYQFTTHLIPLLKLYFSRVDTQFEIRNLPPHFVFTCHK